MEMFFYGFMQRAFQASFLISLIAPILGLFLILRRQSLMADTLSHVSLAGVALGMLIGVNPTVTNILVVVAIAILLEYLRLIYRSYSEISIAILMSGGMAVALVLMGLNGGGATLTVDQFLFGSIVTISQEQVWMLLTLTIIIGILYSIFRKPMYILTFDEDTAFTAGLPIKLMSILFNVLTGVTIAVIMPIVGALLVSAILILPAAISMRLSKSFTGVILIGIVIAVFGMITGLISSYQYGTPPGATITLIFIGVFVVTLVFEKFKVKKKSI
ncbi:metal ABC transporter permease [Marinilactibacillus psychrotolerans]|uniref:Mn/Zn ABC-type transport system permease protein n=1 Tax=Marinilactibacillus psychrotolerans TaxID=191770 RepID=A0AAV3WQ15_9LACT|nr:metal ABC transporter permease [Marinilactibacillus psychrotolerans]GEL65969.1 zinc ABC transporter permease [Marinilactibacillus psychrotolerans]GEQ34755.1 Mn/Zn ABC-type transport system permease protein [Marinilactibacillus psychrotolerans]